MIPTVVLTAGLGTRLDPLSRLIAKPAVPVGGRTLVEFVLDWLREYGIADVVLNLHHKPETITAVLGDGAHLGMRIRYSWENPILGSAGGPKRALSLLAANRVLVVNGDTVCRVDLRRMLEAHERSGAEATLAVIENPAPEQYNGVVLDEDDRVCAFVPKGPAARGTWHFVGVQIANAEIFSALPPDVPAETTSGLYLRMMADRAGSVRAHRVSVPFMDVGTPRDYLRVALEHAAAIGDEDRAKRCVVWPGGRVPADADLEDCVVATALPAGFRARGSVLVPASVLRPGEPVPTTNGVAVFPLG